ncbi:hypothetical protein [Pseudomonas granadensis]|uniref:hypothetical protein n=1 Tax=Pseudomonas granadensis TaxID=1421430 RepID=UPI001428CAF8|nr:hypothetical protein [Pseudomonas granadensis]
MDAVDSVLDKSIKRNGLGKKTVQQNDTMTKTGKCRAAPKKGLQPAARPRESQSGIPRQVAQPFEFQCFSDNRVLALRLRQVNGRQHRLPVCTARKSRRAKQ